MKVRIHQVPTLPKSYIKSINKEGRPEIIDNIIKLGYSIHEDFGYSRRYDGIWKNSDDYCIHLYVYNKTMLKDSRLKVALMEYLI